MVLILPVPLLDILMVWRPDGGGGNGGRGSGSGGGSGNGGSIISGCGSSSSDTAFLKKSPGYSVRALLEHKLWEILTLVDIPATQSHMVQKELERLVWKIHSMHLAVPGAVAHVYHIQRALS